MAAFRKHWRMTAALALLFLGAGAWLYHQAEGRMVVLSLFLQEEPQPPSYPALDEVLHDAVVTLLNDLSLDRDALIALNVSSAQAEALLSTSRTWQQNNQAMITSLNNTIDAKRHAVRQLEKATAMGPYDSNREGALSAARQELQDAQAAYQSTLSGLESNLSSELTASQRLTWTAIKSGWGQQMPLRMLDLTDEQRLTISDAHHRYQRQHAAASSESERAAALTAWQSALDSILTTEQKAVVESYNTHYAAASEAVTGAFDTVLQVEPPQGG